MSSLQELLKQQQELNEKIAKVREESRLQALASIKKLADDAGLSLADIKTVFDTANPKTPKTSGTRAAAPIKYKDDNGNTWSGRGALPRWITTTGKSKEAFLIKESDQKGSKKEQPTLI